MNQFITVVVAIIIQVESSLYVKAVTHNNEILLDQLSYFAPTIIPSGLN